jgi:PadR family transcriptional regulator PadR
MQVDAQLKKGILEMCILYTIQQKEMYGYDVMKYMSTFFPEVNESTIYAILRRLNKEGLTESYYGQVSNGPKRKYYRILEKGRESLKESIADWNNILAIVKEIGIE